MNSSTTLFFPHPRRAHIAPKRMPILGSRELEVLDILWDSARKYLSAQEVQSELTQRGKHNIDCVTVNTVHSTLERLVKKQLLTRSKKGRAFLYEVAMPRQKVISGLIKDIALDMSCGDTALMISGFIEFLESEDPQPSNDLARARLYQHL